MTRRGGGGVRRGESTPGSSQFPKCPPQPRTPREVPRAKQRREGEGGDRSDLGEKVETQKGREQSSQ